MIGEIRISRIICPRQITFPVSEHSSRPQLNITEVARETGLGKDSLRAWERRYGFPTPSRDAHGERLYTQAEVDRLRAIQRLLLAGQRPGKVVGLAPDALEALLARLTPDRPVVDDGSGSPVLAQLLAAVAGDDIGGLRRQLSQAAARLGLAVFMNDIAAPLAVRIGKAWMDGSLQVYQEHLGIEALHSVLRQAMQTLPEPSPHASPRVLLTTLPGETHGLGLLMAEAMLSLEGCLCIGLGIQTPPVDIAAASRHYRADVVALSAAGGLPARRLADALAQLRARLSPGTALWLGGHGACFNKALPAGVEVFADLQSIAPAVQAWRAVTPATRNAA